MTDTVTYGHLVVVKSAPDVWSPNPFSIKSTFKLSVKHVPNEAPDDPKIYTDVCGFGWIFRFLYTSRDGALGGLEVRFEPCFVRGAGGFGTITSSIRLSGVGGSQPKLPGFSASTIPFNTFQTRGTPLNPTYAVKNTEADLIRDWVPWGTGEDAVPTDVVYRLEVTLGFSVSLPNMVSINSPVASTARKSIRSGETVDIQFHLYQAKNGRKLSRPKALYGVADILRGHCDYLDILIEDDDDFQRDMSLPESCDIDIDNIGYYDSDSDFEDDEEYKANSNIPVRGSGSSPHPSTKPILPIVASGERLTTSGSTSAFRGQVVALKSFAFKTWEAFLDYIYTGEIIFAPLSSYIGATPDALCNSQQASLGVDPKSMTRCSPKSMYRLADELDLPELKTLSFKAIQRNITADNVVTELFSKFTQMYPEIEKFELQILLAQPFDKLPGLDEALKSGTTQSSRIITELLKSLLPQEYVIRRRVQR